MAGIYIHIPFCKQACHYCDFHFSTNIDLKEELVQMLCSELELQRNYLGQEVVATIYLGGGTPSLLSPEEIGNLLQTVHRHFRVAPAPEITLEANPDDLSLQKLTALRAAGINRLSIGIQSFVQEALRFLNRAHSADIAMQSFRHARDAGFENISIDLIYAIPGQTRSEWQHNIQQAIALAPEHISAYSLTIEPRTVFGDWQKKGRLPAADDDEAAWQLEALIDELDAAGYEQYEVSNFAMPGMESKHNSSYWKQLPYLGIGPSAHSYDRDSRQFNVGNNHRYVRSMREGIIPCEREVLSPTDLVNEYLLTTLRTKWGADLKMLKDIYGYDLMTSREPLLNTLFDAGMARVEGYFLKLTRKGRMMADKISLDLFLVS